MVVNIEKFLIISQTQFEELLTSFNSPLTINDSNYMLTYLFVNLMAYFIIYFSIRIIFLIVNSFFSKRGEIL